MNSPITNQSEFREDLKQLHSIYLNGTVTNKDVIEPLFQNGFLDANKDCDLGYSVNTNGIGRLVDHDLLVDLFVEYEQQPPVLKKLMSKWESRFDDELNYGQCAQIQADVEEIGYHLDYYLDASPFWLVKLPANYKT
jgi:hypothetical protein